MKKRVGRLALHRETLRFLGTVNSVRGGASVVCGTTFGTRCGTGDENTYGNCQNTNNVCSGGCQTGGACTGASCPSDVSCEIYC